MKDPLQTEATHYEVLGVERGATNAEIEAAFKAGLVKGANVQKLLAAKQALQRPSERAMVDLFQYNPHVLARLSPNPLQDLGHLQPAQRAGTAGAWEKQLRAAFPDVGVAHSLGLLWYWWALFEEGRRAEGEGSKAPLDRLWEQAIPYWAMVAASREFWEGPAGVGPELAKELPQLVVERLRNHLLDLGLKYPGSRYPELELALTAEVRTAKEIRGTGLRTAKGAIAAGPLLLQRMGILDAIRQDVEAALRKQSGNAKLKALRDSLSPYSSIAILLDSKKPQNALEAIEALPAEHKALAEVSRLHARALLELGRQQASLGSVEAALESWKSALGCKNADDIAGEVRSEVASVCQTRAVALQKTQPGRAIHILEEGVKLVEDEKLRLTLAELLVVRGIERINEANEKAEKEGKGVTPGFVKAVQRGIADLERAAELGSKRAADQLEAARRIFTELSSGGRILLREANDATARGDWTAAIESVRKALKKAKRREREALKKNLAVCLANRAIESANSAMGMMNAASEEFLHGISDRGDSRCAKCDKFRNSWDSESWFRINLPDGGTATLCAGCAAKFQSAGELGREMAVVALNCAQKDLAEAVKLDPSNEHARKNLKEVKEILAKLPKEATKPAGSSGSKSDTSWLLWPLIGSVALVASGRPGETALGILGVLIVGIIWMVQKLRNSTVFRY